ncbi:MAG: cytochrome P450 [Alphaproteobacteria bacterium]|nr:cytochrome P450 [Rhizobiaceae bacterium]MBU3960941.1 cytochrome P450 [Alphaproteobacteria bacterium]MBU4087882.1 cytochrome P450 [Alphaproteobacteria bacterium]
MTSADEKKSVVDASSGECCPDWDPRSAEVQIDQIRAYDHMRETCPVAYSDYLGWSLFRHADILQALTDHETFSNVVSRHPSVPNGMDPPQHTVYRRMIDPYFTRERVEAFEPECRRIAGDLLEALGNAPSFEAMACLAEPYAVRIQCGFLGWPASLHEPLLQWVRKNREATLARDTDAMAAIALEFDGHIRSQLKWREEAGDAAPDDITTILVRQTVDRKRLDHGEIVSILRNWTVGELGTIAACVGIIVHFLAENPEIQTQLRLDRSGLSQAIEEMLRLHGPLISNRRTAVRSVVIGGRRIDAGERMTVVWASANRDAGVFEVADEYCPERDQVPNLLYGAGIHICPGAALARMQLRVMIDELLSTIGPFSLVKGAEPLRAVYPASGFASVLLQIDL